MAGIYVQAELIDIAPPCRSRLAGDGLSSDNPFVGLTDAIAGKPTPTGDLRRGSGHVQDHQIVDHRRPVLAHHMGVELQGQLGPSG